MPRSIDARKKQILREVKRLSCEYYQLTQKPLGVTGEVAEYEAAQKLGLNLTAARNPGFDACQEVGPKVIRYQIKGRVVSPTKKYLGRVPKIVRTARFDRVLLVLLDKANLDAIEIWEAPRRKVLARLERPGSKARNERGQMGISQFKSIANLVWPTRQ
jgi:hypothetical protein